MYAGTSTLNAAAAAAERILSTSTFVDWDRTGYGAAGSLDDITDFVNSISIDRTITTDLPDSARLVTGSATASATLELGGHPHANGQHGGWLWSPYNPVSEFYGLKRLAAPIKASIGMTTSAGNEQIQRFTGRIRTIDTIGSSRVADLQALDNADTLRSAVSFPNVANSYYPNVVQQQEYPTPAAFGIRPNLDGTWPIDYTLRKNGYYASPPPRAQCAVSATMHGSATPDVGDLMWAQVGQITDSSDAVVVHNGQICSFGPGNFSEALTPPADLSGGGPVVRYDPVTELPLAVGSGFAVEFWVNIPATVPATPGNTLASVTVGGDDASLTNKNHWACVGIDSSKQPFLQVGRSGQSASTAVTSTPITGTGWVYVLVVVSITSTTTATASFTLNANTRGLLTQTVAAGYISTDAASSWKNSYVQVSGRQRSGLADYGLMLPIEALQVTTDAAPASNLNFVPTAVLDDSLNPLTALPQSDTPQNAWQLIQDIAAAELGMAWFDEAGIFRFYNRNHLKTPPYTTSQMTVTSDRNLKDLQITESRDSIANRVIVTSSPVQVQLSGWVWSASDLLALHSFETKIITIQYNQPVVDTQQGSSFVFLQNGGTTPLPSQNAYRACTTPNPQDVGGACVSNLGITIKSSSTSAQITIVNPNPYPVYLVSPPLDPGGSPLPGASTGDPTLLVRGRAITAQGSVTDTTTMAGAVGVADVSDAQSIADFDSEFAYSMPTTVWLQDYATAVQLANDLLAAMSRPIPMIQNVSIVADPRLQLADRVTIVDTTGTALNDDGWIVGINETITANGGYTMTLTLRMVGGVDAWIMGDPNHSQMGSTTILGGVY